MVQRLPNTDRTGSLTALADPRRARWSVILLVAPLAVYLAVFYVVPLSGVLLQSLYDTGFTLEHYKALWRYPIYLRVLLNTLDISFRATLACVILGYPVAFGMAFFGPLWRAVLLAAITLPFWISVLVRTYSWMIILGRFGPVNSFLDMAGLIGEPLNLMYNRFGVFIGLTYVLLPYAVLPMHSVMQGIDRDLLRAADSLGASPWRRFSGVFLRLSLPGVAAAFLLTFIVGVGAFVTPALMGGLKDTVIAMSIDSQLEIVNNWGLAASLSIVLLAVVLFMFALCVRFMGLESLFGYSGWDGGTTATGRTHLQGVLSRVIRSRLANRCLDFLESAWLSCASRSERFLDVLARGVPKFLRNRPWSLWAVRAGCLAVTVFMMFPLGVILPVAFSNDLVLRFPPGSVGLGLFKTFFNSPVWMRAAMNSLSVAFPVTLLATVLGALAAMGVTRSTGNRRRIIYGILISPLILPAVSNAVAMYFFMAKLKLIGTIEGLILAHTVLAAPFAVIVMTMTFQGLDRDLELASSSLGAGRIRTFVHITLPLVRPGLLTAAIFAFIASFDECITALFICGARSTTLPKQMWDNIRDGMDPVIAAVAALLVALAAFLMAVVATVRARKGGVRGRPAHG